MKLKKWITLAYILVMLIPLLTIVILYKGIQGYNKKVEFKEYINTLSKIQKYEERLTKTDLYIIRKDKLSLLDAEDKNTVKINLYSKDGSIIYSSVKSDGYLGIGYEQLYKNLYEIKRGSRADSLKKPVFLKGEIVGFYEITISRLSLSKGVDLGQIIALSMFAIVLIIVLTMVMLLINKKLTKPIAMLMGAMTKFAIEQEDVKIDYHKDDEIGELIKHFDFMKNEVNKSRLEIKKQQKDKEYLIAAISHDMKTPLTSIRAYTEALKNYSNLDAQNIEDYTNIIINKSDHMKNMIDDLLMYTLLTTEYKLDFVEVDGEEFFEMLYLGYDELCEKNGIKLIQEIKVDGSYKVDVKQLTRVIDNLMSNAIRYTEKQKYIYMGIFSEHFQLPDWICDEYKVKIEEFMENSAVILVKNQGKSIPKPEQERIFTPFYQVDDSRNKISKNGTGLGLSIVKIIIEKHGGKVKIFSDEKEGTVIACFINRVKR